MAAQRDMHFAGVPSSSERWHRGHCLGDASFLIEYHGEIILEYYNYIYISMYIVQVHDSPTMNLLHEFLGCEENSEHVKRRCNLRTLSSLRFSTRGRWG